ncbi:hypothetical protein BDV95DRAFT_556789 [Massariosphaeria phaeospora]|uniref:UDENN domain-containing protein n=1 Tax=Massariosphaeria phaeospora TaxID=100035 RepID=A0A7C8MH36_9PLEO|nr:hypothetical protein BDV95DRAFT_556789 [Massariosphaeria phaeospora]
MEKLKNKVLHPHRRSRQPEATTATTTATSPTTTTTQASVGFQHWAVAFIVCNFNVDIGPEVEFIYPPNVPFSTTDLTSICFNSFPEQQSTETAEDLTFNFAISNNSPDINLSSPQAPHGSPDTFYNCCVFRQEFDDTMKRSFNQRTLCLVSHHSFLSFYRELLHRMTESGVISDPTALEAAYSQIMTWPPPSLGRHELPFLGSLVTLDIAPYHDFPLQGLGTNSLVSDKQTSITAYEPIGSWDTIMQFMPCITDLYVVYEKLLLCESVIVIAQSPQLSSEAISSLVDLIRPVPYAGVIRPYMTMQSEFRSIGIDGGTPRPFLVGITNPFLLKRILAAAEHTDRSRPHILYLQHYDGPVPTKRHHSLHHKSSRNALLDLPGGGIEVHSPSKRFLKSESSIISQIESLLKVGDPNRELGPLIRRHFAELTAQVLSPINRYLATSNVVTPGGNHHYASFSLPDFLHDLSKHGTAVKIRGQGPIQRHRARDGIYESFCHCPNFYAWLEMKINLEKEASAGLLGSAS